MAKDAVATMGNILPDDAAGRDAVHVAVFSAFSAVKLRPGQDIAIIHQGEKDVEVAPMGDTVAIVDPFLNGAVMPGDRFWAYLYPRTITALSHRWSHPALEEKTASTIYVPPALMLASEKWLREFADRAGLSYQALLMGADDYIKTGEYLCQGGKWEGFSTPKEFWPHYEAVTGLKIDDDYKGNFFTCSC
jgi:hypothetical protein